MPQTDSAAAPRGGTDEDDRLLGGDNQRGDDLLFDAEHQLRDIQSLTHASLARLDLDEFLVFLLDRVLELLRCDTAAVLLLDPGSDQLIARASRGIEEEVRQGVRVPLGVGFAGRIAVDRRPVILDRVDHTTVSNPILWEKGIQSMLGVPLITNRQLIGVLHVGSFSGSTFQTSEVTLLELVADRVAGAVQTGITQSERRAAGVLQRSLLPSALPRHPDIEFGSRYAPAERGDVGGDWYDAFEVPSGDVWVMTGDVTGHGLQPAVVMGRLRSAVRSYALLGMSPEDVLRGANRKLQYFEPGAMATMVCGVLSPPFNEIRMCSAGHPPPVIVHPGEEPFLVDVLPVPTLGVVDDLEPQSTLEHLVDGSIVVLYTDGLVERRDEDIAVSLERLRAAVGREDPSKLCGRLMDSLIGSYIPADDVALMALRVHPRPTFEKRTEQTLGDLPVVRSELFPAVPSSVRKARRFIRECVGQLGLERLRNVELMVSELATNAVRHARSPFDVTVEKLGGDSFRIELRDFGEGTPHYFNRGREAVGGRGLQIVDVLARNWGVESRAGGRGKSTWFIVSG
jgi:anti-sigma regulatory factor (Ser/Thr protein kinase)/putative methionine-R-sulfoxide reductase with GAF domain